MGSHRGSGTSGYQCHLFDEICNFKQYDYLQLYDSNNGTYNDTKYQSFNIIPMPFPSLAGVWRSGSNASNKRVWNVEVWPNDTLYSLDDKKVEIEVQATGYYRVHAHVMRYAGSNVAGHSAIYVN